jgi:hypothetical protein
VNVARAFGLSLLISGTLFADVLVLKDGTKVGGRIVDKGLHYEVTTDAGLRTWTRDEVDHVVTSPKELLGETDKLYDEAKKQYTEALALTDASERNSKLKEAIDKVRGVREALASTRELFPEDKYADLDQKLVQTMQLMRMLRERVSVDVARAPSVINGRSAFGGAPSDSAKTALAVLIDPAQRSDPAKRASAHAAFRDQRSDDLSAAAMLFLGRTDAEWRLQGATLKALQEYFSKPWLKDAAKLGSASQLEAAAWLAAQIAAIRKAEPAAPVEALQLFGAGHLGCSQPGPDADKVAKGLLLIVDEGVAGTAEGQAVHDLDAWIATNDFDLAALAFTKEFRDTDTPAVRYVWSYALTCIAHAKKKGFDRAVTAYNSIQNVSAAVKEHLSAMARSVKAAALCANCLGEGKLRCTNCHGIKEVRFPCEKCHGKGKYLPPGLVQTPGPGGRMRGPTYMTCTQCKGSGYEKVLRCEKCKDGFLICKQCDGKPKPAPDFDDLCARTPCADCDGRGSALRNVRWACPSCLGLGQKLSPKADPSKLLP